MKLFLAATAILGSIALAQAACALRDGEQQCDHPDIVQMSADVYGSIAAAEQVCEPNGGYGLRADYDAWRAMSRSMGLTEADLSDPAFHRTMHEAKELEVAQMLSNTNAVGRCKSAFETYGPDGYAPSEGPRGLSGKGLLKSRN